MKRSAARVGRALATALPWLAGAAAILVVGVAAMPLRGHLAGVSGLAPPGPFARPVRAADRVPIDGMIALAPFGRPAEPALPSQARAPAVELTLHGVVVATAPGASRAILSGPSLPAAGFSVGEQVTGGVSLDAVFGDHVVVRVDGRPETLAFADPQQGAERMAEPGPAAGPAPVPAEAPGDGFAALKALLADAGGGAVAPR